MSATRRTSDPFRRTKEHPDHGEPRAIALVLLFLACERLPRAFHLARPIFAIFHFDRTNFLGTNRTREPSLRALTSELAEIAEILLADTSSPRTSQLGTRPSASHGTRPDGMEASTPPIVGVRYECQNGK